MGNVDLVGHQQVTAFRKIALGTWQTTYDPSIYGTLRLRMEPALAYIEGFRAKTGRRLTVTHLVIKAVALALKACPEANAVLRFNRIYLRRDVDIAALVLMEENGKFDLSAAKITHADQKSLVEIVDELEAHAKRIRAREDKALESTRQSLRLIPSLFINSFLKLLAFLLYTLNLDLSRLGLPKDPFGGATVTSLGSLGLELAYVPLVPYSRCPIFVAPGQVLDAPVIDGGTIVPGKIMHLCATFDHRVVDGAHAAVLSRTVQDVFARPEVLLDPL